MEEEAGYDDNRFQSPVPQNLRCTICCNILKQPMQCVKNEHSFCKPCIHRHLQQTKKCPICMERLTLQTLRPSRLAADFVSELMINCDNALSGCGEIVKVGKLEDHVAECEFSSVKCSNDGCEVIINRKDQPRHEENDCTFRLAECQTCGELVNYRKRKLHCYVTKEDMNEVKRSLKKTKDEMVDMKAMVTNMSRELTHQIGEMKKQMNNMKCQIFSSKDCQSLKEEPESDEHSGSLDPNAYSGIREDIINAGGVGGIRSLKSVEIFSWETRQWTRLAPMMSVYSRSTSFVYQGQMFVCGGIWRRDCSIQVLQLGIDDAQWKNFPCKLTQEIYGHASVVYEDHLLVFGGVRRNEAVDDIYEISLVSPYSSQLAGHLPEPIAYHGAQRFGNKVVIVGGKTAIRDPTTTLDNVLLYDITNNCCQTLAPLPFAVCDMATVAWKDSIIIIGGWGQIRNGRALDTVMSYNITDEECKMLPPMKQNRVWCTAVVTGNVIIVMGGYTGKEDALNTVECFNFDTYSWEDLPPMTERRYGSNAVVKNLS